MTSAGYIMDFIYFENTQFNRATFTDGPTLLIYKVENLSGSSYLEHSDAAKLIIICFLKMTVLALADLAHRNLIKIYAHF